jgi:hypothetical protein
MNSLSWEIFRQLINGRSPPQCDHLRLSSLLQTSPAPDSTEQNHSHSDLTDDIFALTQEVHELKEELAVSDDSNMKAIVLSLARQSRELSRSISLLRVLTIPEQIRVLELQLQQCQTSKESRLSQCRELQKRIASVRTAIERMPEPQESPLAVQLQFLKDGTSKEIELHEALKAVVRGESEIPEKTEATVDDTTAIQRMFEEVQAAKTGQEQKRKELEYLRGVQEKEMEALHQKVKQRDFYLRQEPIVFRRPPRGDRKTATELFEIRPLEKPTPKKFVRSTSPHLLASKKVPEQSPMQPTPKYYHELPKCVTKSLLEQSIKAGKAGPIQERRKKRRSRLDLG